MNLSRLALAMPMGSALPMAGFTMPNIAVMPESIPLGKWLGNVGDKVRVKARRIRHSIKSLARTLGLDLAREITKYTEGAITWVDGTPLPTFDLRRDFPVLRYLVRLTGRLTVSGGTTDGTIQAGSLRNMLSRIQVEGTRQGRSVLLKDYIGELCHEAAHFFNGTPPELDLGGFGEAGQAESVGTFDFAITYPIEFHAPGLQDPFGDAFLLDAWRFSQLRLRLTTLAAGGMVSGGDRVHALTAFASVTGVPQIDVVAEVASDVDTDVSVFSLYTEIQKTVDVSSNARDLTQGADFDPGGLIARVLLRSTGTDAALLVAPRDSTINTIRLEGAQQTFWDNGWSASQQAMKTQLGLELIPVGYSLMHFIPEGDPQTALDTRPLAARNVKLQNHIDSAGNQLTDTSSELMFLQQRFLAVG